jgi:prepilin-type N-terminal cleavage/methylation domain-containing protein/prepilin-type processing-associated H-X9-DG protein
MCSTGKGRRVAGFTLVELLVVIGIIALLISVLLPVLGRAREAGNTIKCASNLRTIGQGLAVYLSEFRGAYPASYTYVGMNLGGNTIPTANQLPSTPVYGYVHWSSFLYKHGGQVPMDQYGGVPLTPANSIYHTLSNWDMFQCPSFDGGGLPPANTFPANLSAGQVNDPQSGGMYIDQQAPRMAYTANEAIMGRNKYQFGMQDDVGTVVRTYRYVRAAQVHNSANTVLATEFNQIWQLVTDSGGSTPGQPCKSHRPVHGFWSATSLDVDTVPPALTVGSIARYSIYQANTSDMNPNLQPGQSSNTRLDFVGRNHGHGKDSSGKSLAKTNFLYCDGHVETKRLEETVSPSFQWGEQFYSMTPNGDIANKGH